MEKRAKRRRLRKARGELVVPPGVTLALVITLTIAALLLTLIVV